MITKYIFLAHYLIFIPILRAFCSVKYIDVLYLNLLDKSYAKGKYKNNENEF